MRRFLVAEDVADLAADPTPSPSAEPIHAIPPDARFTHRSEGCPCHPRRSLVSMDGRVIAVHREPPAPVRQYRPLTAEDHVLLDQLDPES